MKWASDHDKPWEAAVGIAILAMMLVAILYIGETAPVWGPWLERLLEAMA